MYKLVNWELSEYVVYVGIVTNIIKLKAKPNTNAKPKLNSKLKAKPKLNTKPKLKDNTSDKTKHKLSISTTLIPALNYHTNFNILLQNKANVEKKKKCINMEYNLGDIETIYYFNTINEKNNPKCKANTSKARPKKTTTLDDNTTDNLDYRKINEMVDKLQTYI
jgi:hypothetical protein